MSALRKDQGRAKRKKPLSHGWIVVPSKSYRDRVYFYNVFTKCSTWINPCEAFDDETTSKSPSETSMKSTKLKESAAKIPRKRISKESAPLFVNENTDIEDYDELHDQYFDNIPVTELNLSHSSSTRNSPNSAFSSQTNKSDDSDSSKSNMIVENDKKELWLQFATSPKKKMGKMSLALSDFEKPSTSEPNSGFENEKQLDSEYSFFDDFIKPKTDAKTSRRSRKKKKKRSHLREIEKIKKEDEKINDNIMKKIFSKTRDKTPAQTGILKFRQEYAETLQSSTPGSKPDKNKNFNFGCESNIIDSSNYVNCIDQAKQSVEIRDVFQQDEQVLNNDSSEEMDWEPSSEEADVRNINEFRLQQDSGQTSNSNIFYEINGFQETTLLSQAQELVLVLDTNIFISCINFVRELRDTEIGDLGYPIIYVPWRVLQELDKLKKIFIDKEKKHLSFNVREAISFLNENFKLKHPRIFGQSFEDFNQMIDLGNFFRSSKKERTFTPDDEILKICLQLQKKHLHVKFILLTNDKNLESKAHVSGIKVFSKESFEKKFLNHNSPGLTCTNSSEVPTSLKEQVHQSVVQLDKYILEVKDLLKEFLSAVVETEMKVAFEADWIKIIHKKPPWMARDALECLRKHWKSVFFLVFSEKALIEAENLNEQLFKNQPVTMEDVSKIISTFQSLIEAIISSQKKKRPYLDLTELLITKLSYMLKEIQLNGIRQCDRKMQQLQYPLILASNEYLNSVHPKPDDITQLDISEVKNLFRDIWESLRCFCCSMSDVINSSNPSSNTSLHELRLKLVQILNEIGELIASLEKIFEIDLPDVNESHPFIIHFAHFLSNLYPAINLNLQSKLPKCLAAFFTDFEGRSLLSRSLNDFREFSQELIKTSEFFKTLVT